jgi:hypothetical protein
MLLSFFIYFLKKSFFFGLGHLPSRCSRAQPPQHTGIPRHPPSRASSNPGNGGYFLHCSHLTTRVLLIVPQLLLGESEDRVFTQSPRSPSTVRKVACTDANVVRSSLGGASFSDSSQIPSPSYYNFHSTSATTTSGVTRWREKNAFCPTGVERPLVSLALSGGRWTT